MTNEATRAQNAASAPSNSIWLSANAGSGKTRVLTDRVARLLLNGADPQNILCLTYTKAAASEMQNRLFKTLGAWAMLPDRDLRKALEGLGETRDDLRLARTLFARAVETPGGLKIQTIHSLCASILRQFPLEAGVSPQFKELDEPGQAVLIDQVLNDLAEVGEPRLTDAAMLHPEPLANMARTIAAKADDFQPTRSTEDIFRAFDVPPGRTQGDIVELAIETGDIPFLKSLIPLIRMVPGQTNDNLANALERLPDAPSLFAVELLEKCLLTTASAKQPYAPKATPTKPVRESPAFAPLEPRFAAIKKRIANARPARIALEAARLNAAVHAFAAVFLPAYEAAKARHGVLDFNDLISRTRRLLTDRSLEWVLYRLDGRIDHILVDEAQDTSPAQWQVIAALAEEMASGLTDRPRTLFVVGDKKQSIYSFQGADAESFDRYHTRFSERLDGAGGLKTREMVHSFRSSPAILRAVDAVFGGNASTGVGANVRHSAFHEDMPGRVDLWPLQPRAQAAAELDWHSTDPRNIAVPPATELAENVADKITELIETGTIPGENGKNRRIEPGDIMVLVQRRSDLFDQIIAACKKRDLAIAGADRLKIGAELAVRDLLALLAFLDMADDDLSLAAALRSPLLGWPEAQLYDLAANRPEQSGLWQELRRRKDEFPDTHALLEALRNQVDFSRPYELLDLILTRYGGRKALLARLGPEIEDGIDELLRQALLAERETVPSLTRFLADARAADIEVKRESDTTGNLIRVMTVHGAKGLESPIVILPDTTFGRPAFRYDLIETSSGLPVVRLGKEKSPDTLREAAQKRDDAEMAERDRLLYVAMTRAEKWLIVCGVEPAKSAPRNGPWHDKVRDGLARIETQTVEDGARGRITRLSHGDWPETAEAIPRELSATSDHLIFPAPVPPGPPRRTLLAPSSLGGDKALGGAGLEDEAAKRRGRQVHRLLEMLGQAADPVTFAARLFATGPDAAEPEDIPGLIAEAQTTMRRHPQVFAPDTLAEVDIVADTPLGRISGTIDRLLLTPGRALAVDFKTNAVVPSTPEETPGGLLRQMGAYLAALENLYPDRAIDVAILWTATAELMTLPHGIVRAALAETPTS